MDHRVNLYVPDVRLLASAKSLRINLSELFVEALRTAVESARHDREFDAYMRVARAGSIEDVA